MEIALFSSLDSDGLQVPVSSTEVLFCVTMGWLVATIEQSEAGSHTVVPDFCTSRKEYFFSSTATKNPPEFCLCGRMRMLKCKCNVTKILYEITCMQSRLSSPIKFHDFPGLVPVLRFFFPAVNFEIDKDPAQQLRNNFGNKSGEMQTKAILTQCSHLTSYTKIFTKCVCTDKNKQQQKQQCCNKEKTNQLPTNTFC